jgi:type II secretory pathway pseudopilin PulG
MKWNAANDSERSGRAAGAFTLIETIGVLAIIAVLAVLVVPATLRHLDRLASEQEMARLQALGEALQKSILRARYIPAHTNWATNIAAQAGLDVAAVTSNIRNHPRVFLVDSSGWLSTNLPYTQTYLGTPALPANARVMLVSSLGKDLPIASGMPNASDFAALWNAPPGTVPSGGGWAGWSGDPDDVKIHRVNLSPLFVKLVLTSYMSATNGQYAVLTNAVDWSQKNPVPFNAGFRAYFLKGTGLRLYLGDSTNTLDSTQVLNEDSSFVYEGGMWKNSVEGRVTLGVGDVGGIVAAFLAATPNTNAHKPFTNYQQILVVDTMTEYISNYNVWAAGNFTDNSLKSHLKDVVQPAMMDAVHGLYGSIGGNNYYPTNGVP